jgi:CRP/FNR family transcriptional regulator, cyclic AMP receptor protein
MKFAVRDGSGGRTLAMTSRSPQRSYVHSAPAFAMRYTPNQLNAVPVAPKREVNDLRRGSTDLGGADTQESSLNSTFRTGEEIFSPGLGDGYVYIVRTGCVRLYKPLPDGRSINLGILGPNTIFTQEEEINGVASGAVAEAMVDTTVSIVAVDDLGSAIEKSPELAGSIVTGMSRRLTELQTLVEHLLIRDTSVRLSVTLMNLATRFGRPAAGGMTAITLPLTHQNLANMIGSNRVTVTRKLFELQELGLARSLGRNAVAVDIEGLRRFAHDATTGN